MNKEGLELFRTMFNTCVNNVLKFRYVLMDSGFSLQENFEYILSKKKDFVAASKTTGLFL